MIIAPHQKSFQFDHVFDSSSTQEQVFNTVASNFVDRFVDGINKENSSLTLIINLFVFIPAGYNVTILAYVSFGFKDKNK